MDRDLKGGIQMDLSPSGRPLGSWATLLHTAPPARIFSVYAAVHPGRGQSRMKLLFLHPEQQLFRVLSWHGHDVICQICLTPAAAREANITKEPATISRKCADFQFVC